jgi:hypothetical protein
MSAAADLGNLSEFIDHNYKNVASYLMACGFDYYESNYKYRKFYNDYENNRCIVIDLYDDAERLNKVELVRMIDKVYSR